MLGIVTRVTLAIEPTYDVAQEVWLDLPWDVALERFDELMGSAYSVSLFTDWRGDAVGQVWRKHRVLDAATWSVPDAGSELAGARPAPGPVHPVPGVDPAACTQQGGVPGPWHERLPHFRLEFTPSAGAELADRVPGAACASGRGDHRGARPGRAGRAPAAGLRGPHHRG